MFRAQHWAIPTAPPGGNQTQRKRNLHFQKLSLYEADRFVFVFVFFQVLKDAASNFKQSIWSI